jgi:hypothetical protein
VTTANAAADLRTAKTDTRVQSLLKQVSRFYKIKYQEVEGPVWFSKINGADVIIGYATANHPAGCLGHELLHLILQKDGFRQIRRGISATIPDAMRLIDVLNNELQHHKIFLSKPNFPAITSTTTVTRIFINTSRTTSES